MMSPCRQLLVFHNILSRTQIKSLASQNASRLVNWECHTLRLMMALVSHEHSKELHHCVLLGGYDKPYTLSLLLGEMVSALSDIRRCGLVTTSVI